MYFILKPKENMHGRNLKKWYRRVYAVLIGHTYLPENWHNHPKVKVPTSLLPDIMDSLYNQSIF